MQMIINIQSGLGRIYRALYRKAKISGDCLKILQYRPKLNNYKVYLISSEVKTKDRFSEGTSGSFTAFYRSGYYQPELLFLVIYNKITPAT